MLKKLFILVFGCFGFGGILIWQAGSFLSAPVLHPVPMPAQFIPFNNNGTAGSLLTTQAINKCALLLHGVRADRSSMAKSAEYLHSLGITLALIDMQAHGETPGERISFGYFEARDAANALDYLKNTLGCTKVLAIGHSLGGAAILLGPAPTTADAVVLESVYPTIEAAVANRLEAKVHYLARFFAPLLVWQIPLRLAITPHQLRPIEAIKKVKVPIFIIGGGQDRHTPESETRALYTAATGDKRLWIVPQAPHVDLYNFAGEQYEQKLTEFIDQVL